MIYSSERIFDTMVDTNKLFVSMKTRFVLREYKNKGGLSPISLHITGNGQRERYNMALEVDTKEFDRVKQRLRPINERNRDINLILDNMDAKITSIKTVYRLSERLLTPKKLIQELRDGMPRVNFIAFFKHSLEEERSIMQLGSWKRHRSVYKKLREYQEEILFQDLTIDFFESYKKHLVGMGNVSTTISSNIASIKKYVRLAQKKGIRVPIDLDELKTGSTKGNRISLNQTEIKRLAEYYFSGFIKPSHKLVTGYFLFGCLTGLRISDIQKLTRNDLANDEISFVSQKTKTDQVISLNMKAREIIEHEPDLFVTKLTDQYINRELKDIFKFLGVNKKITFHVSRHTFATSFLKMGGQVEKLQLLLGHSSIKQTMVYVHIVNTEANKEIFLLDKLF